VRNRLALALGAALVLTAYTFLSRYLPVLEWHAGIVVSAVIGAPLFGLLIAGLWPAHRLGHRLLIVTAVTVALAVLFSHLGWIPAANLAKVLAAASLGFWLASQFELLWWYIPVAAASAAVDMFSVFAGPTKALLAHGPVVVGYFTVAMSWWGYTWHQAYTALGSSDLIFFALYYAAAERFGLRRRLTLACMAASFVVTVTIGLWFSALPALPLLAVGFVAPNADLLWRAAVAARAGRGEERRGEGD
jgi:hypothetical protein